MVRNRRKSPSHLLLNAGFTLVELLIVLSIIGILARFLFVNFAEIRSRGRDSRRKSDLANVKKALRLYYNDFQNYPSNDSGLRILGCGVASIEVCSWGASWLGGTTTYMAQLPRDPVNIGSRIYKYEVQDNGESFRLTALLENASDQDAIPSQERCGISPQNLTDNLFMMCAD